MNRLGFRDDNLRRTLPELLASPNLELDAVYTHFATADDPESPLFNEQRVRFERALAVIEELAGLGPSKLGPDAEARPARARRQQRRAPARLARLVGSACVPGCCCTASCRRRSRRTSTSTPVITLDSRVVAVKGVRAGEGVGYGVRFTAERPTTIAIVPAGYADGLDLRLAGRGAVLIRGRRAPIVGSVCMDMLMADVTGLRRVAGRRGRHHRIAGRRAHRRARDGRADWDDPVRDLVQDRIADRTGL